jgi:hypothetical protein
MHFKHMEGSSVVHFKYREIPSVVQFTHRGIPSVVHFKHRDISSVLDFRRRASPSANLSVLHFRICPLSRGTVPLCCIFNISLCGTFSSAF